MRRDRLGACPDRYSAVKTSTGLIRAALKPGIEHESTAIAITTATASAIVAFTPDELARKTREVLDNGKQA